jgi:hypothetical protein
MQEKSMSGLPVSSVIFAQFESGSPSNSMADLAAILLLRENA